MLPHIIIIMKISYPAPVAPPTSCVFRHAQSAQALARIIEACTRRRESSNFQPEKSDGYNDDDNGPVQLGDEKPGQ